MKDIWKISKQVTQFHLRLYFYFSCWCSTCNIKAVRRRQLYGQVVEFISDDSTLFLEIFEKSVLFSKISKKCTLLKKILKKMYTFHEIFKKGVIPKKIVMVDELNIKPTWQTEGYSTWYYFYTFYCISNLRLARKEKKKVIARLQFWIEKYIKW